MNSAYLSPKVSAVQVAPAQLLVECHNSGLLHTINTDTHIRGTCVTKVQREGGGGGERGERGGGREGLCCTSTTL